MRGMRKGVWQEREHCTDADAVIWRLIEGHGDQLVARSTDFDGFEANNKTSRADPTMIAPKCPDPLQQQQQNRKQRGGPSRGRSLCQR